MDLETYRYEGCVESSGSPDVVSTTTPEIQKAGHLLVPVRLTTYEGKASGLTQKKYLKDLDP